MKVDNFVSNRLKNYIWYISVATRPPQVCIPGYAPAPNEEVELASNESKQGGWITFPFITGLSISLSVFCK